MASRANAAAEEKIREYCKGKIAHYKILPELRENGQEFPMSVTGKIQKFNMREVAIEELGLHAASKIETA
ncbi:MAG: hypothetical protein IH963_06120 [Chloroflexi bacterium]|nr:hypothetical protein [Chloroflexota bacterium]